MWDVVKQLDWLTIGSLALNAVGVPAAAALAVRYGWNLKRALAAAAVAARGLAYLEQAVQAHKAEWERAAETSEPVRKVTHILKSYGPQAVAAVDAARDLLRQADEQNRRAREEALIAAERAGRK